MRPLGALLAALPLLVPGCGRGPARASAREAFEAMADAAARNDRAALLACYSTRAKATLAGAEPAKVQQASEVSGVPYSPDATISFFRNRSPAADSEAAVGGSRAVLKIRTGDGRIVELPFSREGSGWSYEIPTADEMLMIIAREAFEDPDGGGGGGGAEGGGGEGPE